MSDKSQGDTDKDGSAFNGAYVKRRSLRGILHCGTLSLLSVLFLCGVAVVFASYIENTEERYTFEITDPFCGVWEVNYGPKYSNTTYRATTNLKDKLWVVGSESGFLGFGPERPLIRHLINGRWEGAAEPKAESIDMKLTDIVAVDDRNIWAVGYASLDESEAVNRIPGSSTLILHSEGSQWTSVYAPSPGYSRNMLHGIAVTSADDAWAVGSYDNAQNKVMPLLLNRAGASWRQVSAPTNGPQQGELYAVAGVSPADVWAVGNTGAMHWNGSKWDNVEVPDSCSLKDLAAITSNDVWAVGGLGVCGPTVHHWNGKQWTAIKIGNLQTYGYSYFSSIAASSGTDIWIVGMYDAANEPKALLVHWNGSEWSNIPLPPRPKSIVFEDVVQQNRNELVAVGWARDGEYDKSYPVSARLSITACNIHQPVQSREE